MERKFLEHAIHYAEKCDARGESSDKDKIWSCQWFLRRCKQLEFGRELIDFQCEDSDYCAEAMYINLGETDTPTIMIENGELFISSWGDWLEEKEQKYCQEQGKVRCSNCGEFCNKEFVWRDTECSCGYFVDGRRIPEVGSELDNCEEIYDFDSDRLFLCKEKFPTDDDPEKHTTLAIRIEYCEYFDSEWAEHGKYNVSLLGVCPGMVADVSSIESSLDIEWGELSDDQKVEACISHGTYATLWQKQGNGLHQLLQLANEELKKAQIMGGFMLDAPQNAIGNSGWDFMAGRIGFKQ